MNDKQDCPKCNTPKCLEFSPGSRMFYCTVCSVQISLENLHDDEYKFIVRDNLLKAHYKDSNGVNTCSNCEHSKRINNETHCLNKIIINDDRMKYNPPTTVRVSTHGHCKHHKWAVGFSTSTKILNDIFITWWT